MKKIFLLLLFIYIVLKLNAQTVTPTELDSHLSTSYEILHEAE